MFQSIRWRIAVPFIALILIAMFGVSLYVNNFVRQTYLEYLAAELTAESRLIGEFLQPILAETPDPGQINRLARNWADRLDRRVTIVYQDGTVAADSAEDTSKMENHGDRPEIIQALQNGEGSSTRSSDTLGVEMLYAASAVTDGGRILGAVRIAMPIETIRGNLNSLQRTMFGATLFVTTVALFLALWISERTTKPLRELTHAATQMAGGELNDRVLPATSGEVGRLTQAFNVMSVQLNAQIKALETERSKMAAVLTEMSDGIMIVDRQGRVQLYNPAAERIFSVQGKEILGRSLSEVLRHHELIEMWRRCQETGQAQSLTVEISAKRIYLQATAAPLGESLPGSILLLFQNLTRLRHLETVRRDFISNISHELRTPLASLKALTDTLQEGALDDPPAARRFLQRMETEVDALSLMVSELLELSRIESGRFPLNRVATSPIGLLTQAVERLHLQAQRSGLTVRVDCPENLPDVMADPSRLEQVLVNLLHNAIKFTPSGGAIIVSAGFQNSSSGAGTVIFSVADTGVGIPKDDLARIFERFYKADRARSGGGTGLGLAIARHLVEAHGGRIWAESEVGKGSAFYFSIPAIPQD